MKEPARIEKIPEKYLRISPEGQKAFAEFWGDDFQTMRISNWGIGASEDGTMIGLYLRTQIDGKELRASFTFEEIALFQTMLCGAISTAVDRMQEMANGKKGN
jgi:hypothetical protein